MPFEPWLGNFNTEDIQKNEYIRRLKDALTETGNVAEIEYGSFSGDGSGSYTVTFSNAALTPRAVFVYRSTGLHVFAFTTDNLQSDSRKVLLFSDGSTTMDIVSTRIGDFAKGSFQTWGTTGTGLNISGSTYFWLAIGTTV